MRSDETQVVIKVDTRSAYFLPIVPISRILRQSAVRMVPYMPDTHLVESQQFATLTRRLPFARRGAKYSRNPKSDAFVFEVGGLSENEENDLPGMPPYPLSR